MKKYIYVIRNTINKKVYVGQSGNPHERFRQHKKNAKGHRASAIARAISELGEENFYLEILEEGPENPGEREDYWICLLNSMEPNGYNRAHGCKSADGSIDCPIAAVQSQKDIDELKRLLKETDMPFGRIAERYGMSRPAVSLINLGQTYFDSEASYPLRDTTQERKRLEEQSKQLHYMLKYERDKSMKQIAEEYGVTYGVVININEGLYGRIPGNTYPLRTGKVPMDYASIVPEIKKMLADKTVESMADISRKLNVSRKLVYNINAGRQFFEEGTEYPIRRQDNPKTTKVCLDPCELKDIENLIKNTNMSFREIASKYGLSNEFVGNLNRGVILKYRRNGIRYPLRHKKRRKAVQA